MNPEHWNRIKAALDQLIDEPAERQPEILHAFCGEDPEFAAEVLKLLEASRPSKDFLEQGAGAMCVVPTLQEQSSPALEPGRLLADRFEVRRFINRGGMGEVYEAWDSQLNEAVALKTILPYISANPAVIKRFKLEVRHAREVSHPNICRVHELFYDTSTGVPVWFLSMELLHGTTLLECICSRGNLPATLASRIADQVLAALEAAHARGLVHRDLKSSNVMLIESDGSLVRAVITDFGLAITSVPGREQIADRVATGTPGYMAPEQRRGEEVGPAADQYAFGVVLCEMMTGMLPHALAHDRRGLRRVGYPAHWPKVICRCIEERAPNRFRDMAAVRAALLPAPIRKRVAWSATAVLLLAGSLAWPMLRRPKAAATPACLICNTVQITPDVDKSEGPSLSADGSMVAYSSDRAEPGNADIFVQALPSGRLTRITHDAARDTAPSLSPDGKVVAFRSERGGGGIYLASTETSAEPKLLVRGGRDPKISPDGKSLLYWTGEPDLTTPSGKVFRLDLLRGASEPIASNLLDARFPIWHADGRHVLLTGCSSPGLLPDCFDWWVSDADGNSLRPTRAFTALRAQSLLPRLGSLAWQGGQVIFSAVGPGGRFHMTVAEMPLDGSRPIGTPQWLLQGDTGQLEPSLAAQRIAFTRITGALHIWQMRGLNGKSKPVLEKVTDDSDIDSTPFIADGGQYLVFARGRGTRRTIVRRDMATGQETVLVDQGTSVQSPILDRSGTWLAYQQTDADGASAIYAGRAGATMERVCRNCTEPSGWFGNGPAFFFREGDHALALADLRTHQQRKILSEPQALLGDAAWSPAAESLVLIKTIGTRKQIAVQHLNGTTAQPERPEVLIAGNDGTPMRPRWFGDGRGIVYVSNRDGFLCVYGRRFDLKRQVFGVPFALAHFHRERASIDEVALRALNLSVDGDTLFFNLGEQSSTIEVGDLRSRP